MRPRICALLVMSVVLRSGVGVVAQTPIRDAMLRHAGRVEPGRVVQLS
jgi:hypothetical protein